MLVNVLEQDVLGHIPENASLLVTFASFEERCTSLSKAIAGNFKGAVIILKNKPALPETASNLALLLEIFGDRSTVVDVRIDSPVATIDQFSSSVMPRIASSEGSVVVDITTFTHEHLLILLFLLKRDGLLHKIVFTYTGAEHYGADHASSASETKEVWLSRGVKQIRSVLGFPGELVPSKNLHLIIQVGFELERAQKIIESYEPRRLSLGFAPGFMSVTPALAETNRKFFDNLSKFVEDTRSSNTIVDHFEFSCVNPLEAKNSLLEQVNKRSDFNTIICPLNTKISTIGAALLAFECPSVQLCYAEPSIYNAENYSKPGRNIRVFDYLALGTEFLEIA